jgi:DNA-binding transcriptional ArsR family regulator
MTTPSPYRAISDRTRRQILDLLKVESLTAGAIAGRFSRISRPAVSKHLAILRKSRLVQVKKQGREQVYSLNAAPLSEVNAWLSGYEQFWGDQLASFKEYVEHYSDEHHSDE